MKVYINRKVVRGPWGGGNMFVKAYHEYAETDDVKIETDQAMRINPDVILLAGLENQGVEEISVEQAVMYKLYGHPNCQLVLRVNENDARKGTSHMDDMLLKISAHVDATVFVSDWLMRYFLDKGWECKENTVIENGVDREVFKPGPKFNNGKLNIVTHHWSDNRLKGADIYEAIDRFVGENADRFSFTYIGRHQCDFKHTKVIKPLSGTALGEELGKYDLYVSATRSDPGPNHILEARSCGLPLLVHNRGGGAVDLAGAHTQYRDWEELETVLRPGLAGIFPTADAGPKLTTWQECVKKYNDFLEATWQKTRSGSQNC